MAYSGYNAWTVVFGEQPSAAKWNLLGTNDAEFNSKSVQCINRQDDAVNSNVTNQLEQIGWDFKAGDGINWYTPTTTITFPVAYDGGTIPLVYITYIGEKVAADPSDATDFLIGSLNPSVHIVDNTQFTWRVSAEDGATALPAANRYGISWHVIGTKS